MQAIRSFASMMAILMFLASSCFGGEGKGGDTVSDQDFAVLTDVLRVLRRTGGEYPATRNDVAILMAREMEKVSPAVREAMAPYMYFELANCYWHGWGSEEKDHDLATRFYSTAASSFNGKMNAAYITYATNATNLSRDVPLDFIAFIKTTDAFMKNGTVSDIYEFVGIDMALRTRSMRVREEYKAKIVETIKEEIPGFIQIVSDEGTLKRFAKNEVSLKMIAETLPDSNFGKKADELLDGLKAKR